MVSWVQKFVWCSSPVCLFFTFPLSKKIYPKKILLRDVKVYCLCFFSSGPFWFEVLHLLYYKIGFILDDFAQLKSNVNALSTFKVGKAMMLGIKCVFNGLIGTYPHHKSRSVCICRWIGRKIEKIFLLLGEKADKALGQTDSNLPKRKLSQLPQGQ